VSFRDLGVAEVICASLESAGIITTFPIQALTLPLAIGGNDIIGQARTGTGKTLAFGVPLLHRLAAARAEGNGTARKLPSALVVVPTRELAIQVADDINKAGRGLGARVLTVYGGRAYEPQIEALQTGTDIVVGTPGRLLDLANRKNLDLSQVHALVLDEADKMLDLGFLPDVERILRLIPADRQTMLFSATMPGEVVTLARRHMRRATNVRAEQPDEGAPPPLTAQYVFRTHQMDKIEVLARVLQAKDRGLAMVFCQTKRGADQVASALSDRGFAPAAVHGDLGQSQRERALRAFRSGKVDVLVATEVAARGIDVDDVTHVVNYECPDDEKTYLHRIGRTGRAGRAGVAVTFVDWADMQRWKLINDTLGLGIAEPAETYSTSESLYSALSIPPDATGKLPVELRARAGLAAEEEEDLGETGRTRSRPDRDRSGGRASGSRNRTRRASDRGDRSQAAILQAPPDPASPGGTASGSRGAPAAEEADSPPRARRRRRLRNGQALDAATAIPAEAGDQPAGAIPAAAADEAGADAAHGAPSGDADPQAAPARAGRRSRARKVLRQPEQAEAEPADADRPLAATPPMAMPAAPGVPAAIFQAPV
jgi:superfamily II DNA/RNA helicase